MKQFYLILAAVLITINVFAQVPQKMTYQAVVRDDNSKLITNTEIGVEINIYQDSATGVRVYTETQNPTTNMNGLFSIKIGGGVGFDTINWANGPYFLETKIDLDGGIDYTITGVSQLLTVPYALHAKTADAITVDSSKHYVGELYGGGIVFWVSLDGKHGLIASLDDLDGGSGVAWCGNTDDAIGAEAQNIINGASNTAAIIAKDPTPNKAATLCDSYTHDGFSDWYLPSIRELNLLCSQDILIDNILDNDGDSETNGFPKYDPDATPSENFWSYWASNESNSTSSWLYYFPSATLYVADKDKTYRVRAVRSF